jgi:hypothetical protein
MSRGNANRVPPRKFAHAELDHVRGKTHTVRRRIEIGTARDKLFEQVVLNGAGELLPRDPSAVGHRYVIGKDDWRCGVYRERRGNLGDRNAVVDSLNVGETVDRHTKAADLVVRPGVI